MNEPNQNFFAACTSGAETYLAAELTRLGAHSVQAARLGVHFSTSFAQACRICLWTRLASRVLLPLGEFKVRTAEDIYQEVRRIDWESHISSLNTFAVAGIGTTPEIRHSGFLALKTKDAIVDRIRAKVGRRPNVAKQTPDVLVSAHLAQGRLTISLDLSGESLHMRGWRASGGVAPLKETLAALMVDIAGYDGRTRLMDPMCGSGTILIEAVERALGLAPGRNRIFGFERWPTFSRNDKRAFADEKRKASEIRRKELPRVVGWDTEPDQVSRAKEHVAIAGLSRHIRIERRDATTGILPGDPVHLISNVPYGERLDAPDLLDLYARLGERWRVLEHATLTLLTPGTPFRRAFTLAPDFSLELHNGPLDVMLYRYQIGSEFKGRRSDKTPAQPAS